MPAIILASGLITGAVLFTLIRATFFLLISILSHIPPPIQLILLILSLLTYAALIT